MESLNTYNFQEELGLDPISYQVSISDNDKIIKIESDGDLIAELSFMLEDNILSLIGKDNLEVAQIELPNAMSRIATQKYNPEEMSIELGIEQTNGKLTTFCLDVKELVDVYTAGDGIDINDNVISIKIKDAEVSALSVDSEGLGINLDGITEDISRVEAKVDAVDERVDLVNTNIETINEALNGINGNISDITKDIDNLDKNTKELDSRLDKEILDRLEADTEFDRRIDDLEIGQGTSEVFKKELERLDKVDKDELARATAEEAKLQENIDALSLKLDNEIGDRGESDTTITDDINKLKENITDTNSRIDDANTALNEEKRRAMIVEGELKKELDDEVSRATESENLLSGRIDSVVSNAELLDGKITKEVEDRTKSDSSINTRIDELKNKLDNSNLILTGATEAIDSVKNDLQLEINRATAAEDNLGKNLDGEISRSTDEEIKINKRIDDVNSDLTKLSDSLNDEINSREDADLVITNDIKSLNEKLVTTNTNLGNLDKKIDAEALRATNEESNIKTSVSDAVLNFTTKDLELNNKIDSETTRATNSENALTNSLNDEKDRAETVEKKIQTDLNAEIARAKSEEKVLNGKIDSETSVRTSEDSRIETSLNEKIDDEVQKRKDNDDLIKNIINTEKGDRQDSEAKLKEDITKEYKELVDTIEIERDSSNNLLYNLLVNGVNKGQINIPEDKMLESVDYDADAKKLTFKWNASSQQEPTVVSVADLVDTYTVSNGLATDPSNHHNFIIPLNKSKYIKLVNGEIDVDLSIVKPEGSKWTYHLLDGKGNVNDNIINFNDEVNELKSENDNKFAHANKVTLDIAKAKNEVIGLPSDKGDVITIHGVRNKINEVLDGEITNMVDAAKKDAVTEAGTNADAKDVKNLEAANKHTDDEIKKVNDIAEANRTDLQAKFEECSNVASTNSTNIAQLSTGLGKAEYTGGTGVFDELHKLFHDLTHGIDENDMFEYLIKMKNGISSSDSRIDIIEQQLITINNKLNELDSLYWESFGK